MTESGLTHTVPGEAVRLPRIRDAIDADVEGIVHALLEGARAAYSPMPDSTRWLPKFLAAVSGVWPERYKNRLDEIARGQCDHKILVAETEDHRIVGLIEFAVRDDGTGQLYSWHVLPDFHGVRTAHGGPTVGKALMDRALEYLGDIDVYSDTTVGTVGLPAHLKYGFEVDDSVPASDPRLAMPARFAEAGCPPTIALPDGTVVDVGRQVILIRRATGRSASGARVTTTPTD